MIAHTKGDGDKTGYKPYVLEKFNVNLESYNIGQVSSRTKKKHCRGGTSNTYNWQLVTAAAAVLKLPYAQGNFKTFCHYKIAY